MLKAFYFALHFAVIFLGLLIAVHHDMTLGLIISGFFACKWFFMFPQVEGRDQNERLRRYERQHQQWLKGGK
mgnify:FL=1|jgi:hypothetical protein|tara:strand:+ start:289 stop:504 length:216 start_codon:yes stop_codon:yes gene_type:complete